MTPDRDKRIQMRAYEIWEREGRPEGRERSHWEQARSEIDAEGGAGADQSYSAEAGGYGASSEGQMVGGMTEGRPDATPQGFDDAGSAGGMAPGAKRPRRQKQGTKTQG